MLSYNTKQLTKELSVRYGKGAYHARFLMRHVYKTGSLAQLDVSEGFKDNQKLAHAIMQDFTLNLPKISQYLEDAGTIKFTLVLHDGFEIESVIIPMKNYLTLCVSSQVGCVRNCTFCRTAKMGLLRNLTCHEIIAQYFIARYVFKKKIRNIVFMGMGEPFDNITAVLSAIDILTDPFGANILMRRISLSTCGQCEGLALFCSLIRTKPEKNYHLLSLSISLHSANNKKRSALMPVNTIWPLERIKKELCLYTSLVPKAVIYFEYLVIPNLTDSKQDVIDIARYIKGIPAKINLIAYNTYEDSKTSIYPKAMKEDVDAFWKKLRSAGIPCYSRYSKGEIISASCGQLATGKKSATTN